jgi:hypothetical protein
MPVKRASGLLRLGGVARIRSRASFSGKRLLSVLLLPALVAALLGVAGRNSRPATTAPWAGPRVGGIWTATNLKLQTNALLADSSRPAILFAGTDDGVWRSLDGGTRWTRSGLQGHTVMSLAAAGSDLYAGNEDGTIYAGNDQADGVAWTRQPISPTSSTSPVFSLAVSQTQPIVLAGTSGALYRGTRDTRGWHWARAASTGDASISSILWFPTGSPAAIASVFGVSPSLIASDDAGRTWHAALNGLPAVLPTQALMAIDTRPAQVILTTMGEGVWERAASGSWQEISQGLPERHAMPIAALADRGRYALYAGTMGYGIYVKQDNSAWRPFGRGLAGVDNTVLALAAAAGRSDAISTIIAATQNGVYCYLAT